MDFEFIYGDETIYISGSIGYAGDEGNYETPAYYEAIYDPNDLEIIVSGEYDSYSIKWERVADDLKFKIVKQIEERV